MKRTKYKVGDKVRWFGSGGDRRKLYASRATLRGHVVEAERFTLVIETKRGRILVTPDECERG
jgi:hypothetical protein